MSTIKINELATSAISLTDFFVKANDSGLATKNTIQDLANVLETIGEVAFKGSINSASAIVSEDGWYFASDSGTYTNNGGLVISVSNQLVIIIVSATQTVFEQVDIILGYEVENGIVKDSVKLIKSGDVYAGLGLNSNYPFIKNEVIVDEVLNAVLDCKLIGADSIKEYYISFIGRRFFADGQNRNYLSISEVGGTYIAVAEEVTSLVYWEDEPPISGVKVHQLKEFGSSGITGNIVIDWDAITQGNRYAGSDTTLILNKNVSFYNTEVVTVQSENVIKLGLNASFPFKFNDNILLNNDVKNPILYIELYGADLNTDYYLRYFGKKYSTGGELRNYFTIATTGDVNVAVLSESGSNFHWINDTISGTIEHDIIAYSGSGITGKAVIDWDNITDGVRVFSANTEAILNKKCLFLSNFTVPEQGINDTNYRLLLADELYMIEGNILPIYKTSILSNENYLDNAVTSVVNLNYPFAKEFTRDFTIKDSDFLTSLRIAMRLQNGSYDLQKYAYYKDIAINKVTTAQIDNAAGVDLVLGGDSITDFDIASFLGLKLGSLGASVNFQGLRNDAGYKNEGRSGWEMSNVYGKNTIQFDVGGITPLISGTASDLNKNPFIRIATAQEIIDNPEWVFENNGASGGVTNELNYTESQLIGTYTGDYYTLSFIDYVANHSITLSNNKVIFISNWGFNDLNHKNGSEASILDSLMGVDILADRMVKFANANPGKEVILGISPILINRPYYLTEQMSNWIERCIVKVKEVSITHTAVTNFEINVVPVWQSVSREWGYGYSSGEATIVNLSTDNNTKKAITNDIGHPRDFGKNEISNVLLNYIGYKMVN